MKTKRCCCRFHTGERILPIERFNKSKGRQGIMNWCKDCQSYYGWLKRHDLLEIEKQFSK